MRNKKTCKPNPISRLLQMWQKHSRRNTTKSNAVRLARELCSRVNLIIVLSAAIVAADRKQLAAPGQSSTVLSGLLPQTPSSQEEDKASRPRNQQMDNNWQSSSRTGSYFDLHEVKTAHIHSWNQWQRDSSTHNCLIVIPLITKSWTEQCCPKYTINHRWFLKCTFHTSLWSDYEQHVPAGLP